MKAFKSSFNPVFVVLVMVSFLFSCNKDDESSEIVTPPSVTISTIGGKVLLDNNLPAAFTKVTCNNITTTTDAKGFYLFKNITVPEGRCIVALENGFFKTVKPKPGSITYCDLKVPATINEHTFNGASGGTITDASGVSIIFQPGSIQTSNGTPFYGAVKVAVFYLDPTKPQNSGINPIHDNRIIINNSNRYAYSVGAVYVELTNNNGTKLNLISQKPATLSIPIASTRLASTPASILLVSGDMETATWKQEGIALKSGNTYTGTVTHFSWWNTVVPLGTATITGQVKDIAGHPIANASVSETFLSQTVRTDANGLYIFDAYDGYDYEVFCNSYYNMGESSAPFVTPILNVNQIYTVPDIIFQDASIISGSTTDCGNNALTAFVTMTDSMEYYNYSIAGNAFTLFAGASKNVTLLSSQFNQYNLTDMTAGAAGTITGSGTLQVCTTAPSSGNMTITFTSPITGTQTGTLNMNSATVSTDSTNTWSYISLTSIDSLYLFGITSYYIEMWIPVQNSYINSIMPWSQVINSTIWYSPLVMYGETYNNAYHAFEAYGYDNGNNAGTTNITFIGPVGTQVTGSFDGPVDVYDSNTYDLILSGTVTGTFSVTRGL